MGRLGPSRLLRSASPAQYVYSHVDQPGDPEEETGRGEIDPMPYDQHRQQGDRREWDVRQEPIGKAICSLGLLVGHAWARRMHKFKVGNLGH